MNKKALHPILFHLWVNLCANFPNLCIYQPHYHRGKGLYNYFSSPMQARRRVNNPTFAAPPSLARALQQCSERGVYARLMTVIIPLHVSHQNAEMVMRERQAFRQTISGIQFRSLPSFVSQKFNQQKTNTILVCYFIRLHVQFVHIIYTKNVKIILYSVQCKSTIFQPFFLTYSMYAMHAFYYILCECT